MYLIKQRKKFVTIYLIRRRIKLKVFNPIKIQKSLSAPKMDERYIHSPNSDSFIYPDITKFQR